MQRQRHFVKSVSAVYIGYIFRFLSPFIVVPLLARVLGPQTYSQVMLGAALAVFITLLIEYGFQNFGAREIAYDPDIHRKKEIFSTITLSKLALTMLAILSACLLSPFIPSLWKAPQFLIGGIALGIANSVNLTWYFQGDGRLGTSMAYDISTGLIYAVLVLVYVHSSADGPAVLWLQATASAFTGMISYVITGREVGFGIPPLSRILFTIQKTTPLFIARASTSIYLSLSVLILGALSTSSEVANYGSGERIVLLFINAMYPLGQVIFPIVARMSHQNSASRDMIISRFLAFNICIGTCCSIPLIFFGPIPISIIYGTKYLGAVKPLEVLALTIPLVAINQVLSSQVLIAASRDLPVTVSAIVGGAVNIMVALIIVPHLGAFGMSCSRLLSEVSVLVILYAGAKRAGLMPKISSLRSIVPVGR